MWVNFGSGGTEQVLFTNRLDNNNRIVIYRYSNSVYFHINSSGSNLGYVTGPSNGVWTNILMVYNGSLSGNTNRLKVYFNGDQQTLTFAGSIPSVTGSYSTSYLGGRSATDSTPNFYTGKMSNVAIWNSDQSSNVTNIYNYGAPQTSYTVTPKAWYKLDKTSEYAGLNPNWHSALDLEGTSKYVSTGLTTTAGAKSLSYWFKCSTASGYQAMFGSTNGVSDTTNSYLGAATSYWADESISFFTPTGGSGSTSQHIAIRNGHTAYQDGNWHHSVLVYTGSTKYWYIDGISQTIDYRATYNTDPSLDINIANLGIGFAYGATLSGNLQMSNFAYFDQAISAEDVKYLYNGGTPQTNISFEPVSWWKLDNLTTGIQDSGSASNNGTNNGATEVTDSVAVDQWNFDNAVQSQTPNWSSALGFSGSNQWIDCGIDSSIDTGDLSVAFWFYKDSGGPSIQYVFNSGSGSAKAGFAFAFSGLNLYAGRATRTHRGDTNSYINIGVTSENWHHLALTYDDTSKNFILYLDGQEVYTEVGVSNTNAASSEIIFGRISNVSNGYYNGKISNAAIYNTVLDSSAITELYNNGQPETAISSSPVSWWKLDNTTTGIQDSGSASNNGTNNGATEIQTNVWTPRLNAESDTLQSTALVSSDLQFNSAYSSFSLDFDGTNDYVNGGVNTSLASATNFSLSGWFYFDSVANNKTLFSYGGTGVNYGMTVQTYASGNLIFVIASATNDSGSNYIQTNLSSVLTTSTWYNIVCTYDGSQAGNTDKAKIYINGTEVAYAAGGGTIPATTSASTGPFNIGQWDLGGSNRFFNGKIDEVSIFNKTLNQAEITSIYNNGYPKDLTSLSPTSWWRLGEDAYYDGTDFTIPNKISGAPNGTSDNMAASALVADAPGSYAAGLGSSLALADRVGDAALSTANSVSFNMTPVNRVLYPAGYVPTQADNVYSMAFDGTNDYIDCGNNFNFGDGTNDSPFSISAWINMTSTSGFRIFNKYDSPNYEYSFGTGGSNKLQLFIFDTISDYRAIVMNTVLNTGQWYHVVATYDGRGGYDAADGMIIYVDGVPATVTKTIVGSYQAMPNLSIDAYIGKLDTSYTNGKIDEVAIFDYALTPRQIKQDIYNGTTSGKTADLNNISNLTPPIAWYRMGD